MYSGFNNDTAKHLQLDAGAFLKDYDVQTDTWDTAKETKLIGATQGGGSFSAVPTVRRIEVDGVKGAAKGFETIDEWVVTMTANVKELTADSISMALATGKATPVDGKPTSYTKITAGADLSLEDYIGNITWVGRLSGSQDPVIIVLKNALCTNGLSLTMADKSEGLIAMTFTGHYDPNNLDEVPFEIYYPSVT